MEDIITWLVGDATQITDIGFLARIFVLIFALNIFAVVAHELASVGKR